ncbi:putative endonuclease/exonuclease/phosphatase [Lupinus albus]|uniref:Putative endonuclease/exonuclease/phosphatase n=1 Tax=Lupinus albus TaxID=3870 RepID=A0A6A4NFK1_LUPAL|nr:putative endonuclease/exonuclease/phosphatase [Lupinus albus]
MDLQSFTDMNNQIHLPTLGAQFTWTNKRRGVALIEKRLDRSMCNEDWIDAWSRVTCNTMPRLPSHHHPLLLHSVSSTSSRITQFRFHKMCLKDLVVEV